MTRGHWLVSTSGGTQPAWAAGGRELCYFAPDGSLMRTAVGAGSEWTAGQPAKALEPRDVVSTGGNASRNYDVTTDGRRFLMMKSPAPDVAAAPPQLAVVQHFDEELRRLAPASQRQ